MKKLLLSLIAAFFALTAWAQAPTLNEGFEGELFPPEGWLNINVSGPTTPWTKSTNYSHTGVACAFANYNISGNINYLITPKLVINSVSDSISFWARMDYLAVGLDQTYLKIYVSTDGNDVSDFTDDALLDLSASYFGDDQIIASWKRWAISLEDYVGEEIYIAFRQSDNNGYGLCLDDIEGPEIFIPDCAKPRNIVFSNETTTSIGIEFDPGNEGDNAWWIYYRLAGSDDWDSLYITDNPYTLLNLNHSSSYEAKLRTDCDGGELSDPTAIQAFRTACDAITDLPWIESFDSHGIVSGTRPNCWSFPVLHNDWPYIVSNYSNSSPASLKFESPLGVYTYAITPELTDDINNLRVKFYLRAENLMFSGTIEVGVMSDNIDTSTFELVEVIAPIDNAFHQYEVEFENTSLSGPDNYIAFRHNTSNANGYYWLDDVEVSYIPDCAKPSNLAASNITETEVEISWNPGNHGDHTWWVYYKTSASEDWDTVCTTDNPHTLTDLSPSSGYKVMVRTDCSNEMSEESTIINFRTGCGTITSIPWMDNFDTYSTAAGTRPDCWSFPVLFNNNFPSIVTGASYVNSSPASLKFQSQVGVYTYAITPLFTDDINNLKVKFRLKREGVSSGTMEIGVMSDITDLSTFELVEIIDPDDNLFHEYEVGFGGTTLSGANNYIAFRHNTNIYFWFYWLDDVVVSYLFDCARPNNIAVSNIEENEVDISWNSGNINDDAWWVYYRVMGSDDWDSVYATTNPHTLSNLAGSSAYQAMIRTDCGNELSEESNIIIFRTACAPITAIPWMDNFDTYGTGVSVFPECWTRNATTTLGPYVHETAYAGAGSLYFCATAFTYNISALPKIDESIDVSDLRLNFWYRNTYSTDTLKIGVMSDPDDITTWEQVDFITTPNTATWEPFEVSLAFYEGNANYIAFRVDGDYASSHYSYAYVDELVVSYILDCAKPTNISSDNATTSSVDLSWNPGNLGYDAWWIRYKSSTSNDWDSVYTNDNPHTLTGLTAATRYDITIRTDCVNEVSELSYSYFFSTTCHDGPITDFPWEEGFETDTICWEQEHILGTHDWNMTSSTYLPRTGTGFANFGNASSGTNSTRLISPELDISSMTSPYLSFWHLQLLWGAVFNDGELKVLYRESSLDNWTELEHYTTNIVNYTFDSIKLPNPSATYQIAFEGLVRSSFVRVSIDDVRVYDADADGCAPPTEINILASSSSAIITWTPSGAELNWEVRLGLDGTPVTVSNPTHAITELDESTNYTVYVRSNCGDGYSNWISISFTTDAQVAPEVTVSVAAAQITYTTVVLTGEYLQGSDLIESQGFEYKETSESDWEEVEVSGDDNSFIYLAEDLTADTDYEVKAYVVTDTEGRTYSDIVEFTTLAITPPTVSTDEVVVNNFDRTAIFTGSITENTEEVTSIGFEYKKDEDDWLDAESIIAIDTATFTAIDTANFTATTPVLENEQEYTMRAYAETASGKTYGEELDFEITSSLNNIDINSLDITLYPNPATNTTTIIIKGIDGKVTISIIDVQGRIITSVDKSSSENKIKHSFDLDGLAKGMYYIRIETSNNIKTQKLIVQ